MRVLRGELARTSDRQRLLQFARLWLYEHRLIVLRDRDLRTMIVKAIRFAVFGDKAPSPDDH